MNIPRARVRGHWLEKFGRSIQRTLRFVALIATAWALPAGFALGYQACATLHTMTGKFAGCEKTDLGQVITVNGLVTDVENAVAIAVDNGVAGIPVALEGIAVSIGGPLALDTIDCAITAIEESTSSSPVDAGPSTGIVVAPNRAAKIAAARAWLQQKRHAGVGK